MFYTTLKRLPFFAASSDSKLPTLWPKLPILVAGWMGGQSSVRQLGLYQPVQHAMMLSRIRQTGQNQELSFDGLNRHEKLKYSWAVDLGPFKLGRIARQQRAPQPPAGEGGAVGNGRGARPSEHTEAG